ncbi:MAG: DUF362 domain-containing protein [Candidatus Lokiarchaeota archaeon]|nr:DUF362 domain-containing protein [Candidatus Lokiarchaeota archaeon]
MSEKPIVYWAPPVEIFAMRNNANNMITNNLVKTRLVLNQILDNINEGDKVAVKVHVGEALNTRYLRPDYVREVVTAIKEKGGIPTLVETHGLGLQVQTIELSCNYQICLTHRTNSSDHMKIAQLHGYTEEIIGAPIRFLDGEFGRKGKIQKIDGIQLKDVSVASELHDFDKIVVISHFKGHVQACFGGALKQLGIGCVSKRNKHLAHFPSLLKVDQDKCDMSKCNTQCVNICPVKAISIQNDKAFIDPDLCYGCFLCSLKMGCPIKGVIERPEMNSVPDMNLRYIDNAMGVLASIGKEKFRYINFAFDVVQLCDCVSNPGVAIVPDLGIFGSKDPVAIDKACIDAETNAPGLPYMNEEGKWVEGIPSGVEKFKALSPNEDVDADRSFKAATINKLGSVEYELKMI